MKYEYKGFLALSEDVTLNQVSFANQNQAIFVPKPDQTLTIAVTDKNDSYSMILF